MDSFINAVLISVLMACMTGLAVGYRQHRERLDEERWRLKRQKCLEACLEALEVVDGSYSHAARNKGVPPMIDRAKARVCLDKLMLACDNPAVITAFENTIFLRARDAQPALHAQQLAVLRDAIRRELGFGKDLEVHESLARTARLSADGAGQERS